MKFTCEIIIDLPRDRVVELWENNDNLKHWQEGFVSYDILDEERDKKGARSRYVYKMGRKEMEITESIMVDNLPDYFVAYYEHESMSNSMSNHFEIIDTDKTRWKAVINYTKFNGIIPKAMGFLMPGVFKKQTQKWLDNFKAFAEKEPV